MEHELGMPSNAVHRVDYNLSFYTCMNIHCDLAAIVFVLAKLDSVPCASIS